MVFSFSPMNLYGNVCSAIKQLNMTRLKITQSLEDKQLNKLLVDIRTLLETMFDYDALHPTPDRSEVV